MEDAKLLAAYSFIKKINVYTEKIGANDLVDSAQYNVPSIPESLDQQITSELLVELVETANTSQLNEMYSKLVENNREVVRSDATILELATSGYQFVRDHWAEICFIIGFLNKTGRLDRLKRNKKIKTIIDLIVPPQESSDS